MHIPTCASLSRTHCKYASTSMQVCFYASRLNYCQIFCATNSLVLMYILSSLFCCLLLLNRFYFLRFPLFFHNLHYSLSCRMLFNLCPNFLLFLFFSLVLNSIHDFKLCSWLNSNTRCLFFSFKYFSFAPFI